VARVLVVEDDADVRLVIVTMLQAAGHEVIEAADGAEGLEAVSSTRPECIVTDLMMPGTSGDELITGLRAREDELSALPVVVITALSQSDERVRALDARDTCVLHKPAEVVDIPTVVAQMLRWRGETAAPEVAAV
jgi:CheY-like chemotaxis protein